MRIILLSFLLILPLSFVNAQSYLQLGAHLTGMSNTGPIDTKGLFLGYQIGIGADYKLSAASNYRLGGALLYNHQGYVQEVAGQEYNFRMYYFQVPIYVAYPVFEEIQAEAGGYIGLMAGASYLDGQEKIRIGENYRRVDYGLMAGLVFFEKRIVNLYLRYQHSLHPQIKYPEFAPSGEQIGIYRLLQPYTFTAGVRINFRKHE